MGKQEFEQGDSNVVVRNQVVYGALPQDVIDRMGDTTLNLLTNEQTVIPAINELKSNLTDSEPTEISFTSTTNYSNTYGNKCWYYKKNGMVICDFVIHIKSATSGWTTVFTFPEGFRPKQIIYNPLHTWSTIASGKLDLAIQIDGQLQLRAGANGTEYYGHIVF